MNFRYKDLAKILPRSNRKILFRWQKYFSKNTKENNDLFLNPVDISDSSIPNGNAIMLINLVKLGMMDEGVIWKFKWLFKHL